jgi:hypothetical protein
VFTRPFVIASTLLGDGTAPLAVCLATVAGIVTGGGHLREGFARCHDDLVGMCEAYGWNAGIAMAATVFDNWLPARGAWRGHECEGFRPWYAPRLGHVRTRWALIASLDAEASLEAAKVALASATDSCYFVRFFRLPVPDRSRPFPAASLENVRSRRDYDGACGCFRSRLPRTELRISKALVAICSSVDLLRWLPGRLHYTACEYIGSVSSTGCLTAPEVVLDLVAPGPERLRGSEE